MKQCETVFRTSHTPYVIPNEERELLNAIIFCARQEIEKPNLMIELYKITTRLTHYHRIDTPYQQILTDLLSSNNHLPNLKL